MSDMQFTKRATSANPFFNGERHGDSLGRIGAVNSPAGGEVRPERFTNGPNSSGVTRRLGADTPAKGRGI